MAFPRSAVKSFLLGLFHVFGITTPFFRTPIYWAGNAGLNCGLIAELFVRETTQLFLNPIKLSKPIVYNFSKFSCTL